ncbi:MAG: hypothetical protein ABSF49_16970 [Roseiarcus sp.]|jgi:hypothetical protein|uniref:hypothetical protein n=1 Tax=Roseiarcus sp. TaxID=1969460 RepID=UPI003C1BB039
MTMRSTAMASLALALAGAAWAAPALAQSCSDDLQKLSQRRETEMATINTLIKAAKGKQLDPSVFCGKSGGLMTAENAMIAYMEKNKDWCGIPDDTLDSLKANHAKSATFAAKACKVAAEMKKAKEQAANGEGPQAQPLPAGPL